MTGRRRRDGPLEEDLDDQGAIGDDPRVAADCVRTLSTPGASLTLVGAVHHHPASVHRAATIVDARDPDVLALELPPVSLPLFEAYAAEDRTPPTFGGEMSAAIQAASTDRVVGIDGPSGPFLRRLVARLSRERPPAHALRGVASGLVAATRTALVCRVAAAIATHTSIRLEVDRPIAHECSPRDEPARQAADERSQIRRARAVMDAFEPSRAARFRDETREAHMADRLAALCHEGDVVAVVGYGHLAPLVERLTDAGSG